MSCHQRGFWCSGRRRINQKLATVDSVWSCFHIMSLTELIRNALDPEFAEHVNSIGNGGDPLPAFSMLQAIPTEDELIHDVFPNNVLNHPRECTK